MIETKETREEVLRFLAVSYGSGSGYGDGYGDGVASINGSIVHEIDGVQTLIDSVHGSYAVGRILKNDLTTTPCYVAKVGNHLAHGDTLHEAMADATAKYQRNMPVEDRIRLFNEQFPDRDKKVAASELFRWHNFLTGSCEFGRRSFCEEHGLDYKNGEYSVNEFIEICKDAYGGEVIRRLV